MLITPSITMNTLAVSVLEKVDNGTISVNQDVVVVNHHDPDKQKKVKISKLYEFDGLNKVEVKEAGIGSIVAISGIADISIGDTICSPDNPVPIEFQKISEPTIAMQFVVNDSPFAGQEGKFVTSRHLRDRLFRELNTDVSLRVEETDNTDSFKVSGRGELHLSVLVETCVVKVMNSQSAKPKFFTKKTKTASSSNQWKQYTLMYRMNLQVQLLIN